MALPVLSVAQMREWEKASWAAGKSVEDVIDTVGAAIARRLETLAGPGSRMLFLAGKGHNGDDLRAARKHLGPARNVTVLDVFEPVKGLEKFLKAAEGCSWIVDGLFGIGLDRPLDAAWQKLITAVNNAKKPVVAVDVPSGLNAETGAGEGAAIRADVTLTVGAPKRGLLKASQFVGRLEVLADIGLAPCTMESELRWTMAEDFAHLPPRRPVESNKGTYGHLAIYAGSFGYHGAAVLAGQGALRARPGLVTIITQEHAYLPVASQCQSIMAHVWKPGSPPPKTCSAILIGPGLAAPEVPDAFKDEMRRFWRESPCPVIVDASALDWLQSGPVPPGAIRVVTPHPGEAGRMLESSAAAVQAGRVAALRELSQRLGNCLVVLKGHQSLVGGATGEVFINSSGNPCLAQGGSGDILGGFMAGLLAQPEWQPEAVTTVRYAVWEHGAAADRLSENSANWTVEDLSRQLGHVVKS